MLYYLSRACTSPACLLLLLVVLLQQGKGGDMASAFGGGGSQTAFGARAGATVLTRATTVLGALFMIGAIRSASWAGGPGIVDGRVQGVSGPAARRPQQTPAPAPAGTAPPGEEVRPTSRAKVAELADAPA